MTAFTDGQYFTYPVLAALILMTVWVTLWPKMLDAIEKRLRARRRLSPYDWGQDPQMRQPSHVKVMGRNPYDQDHHDA